jgi:hypothetical protein
MRTFLVVAMLLSVGCATAYWVDTNCLDSFEADQSRYERQYRAHELNKAELISVLDDNLTLLSAMELTNHVFKVAKHDYCDANFNEERWATQEKINHIEAFYK